MGKCGQECEVYSRVVGYFRPVSQWNKGKAQEFNDRKAFKVGAAASEKIGISEIQELKESEAGDDSN